MRVQWVASSLALYRRTWCIRHYYHYYHCCALFGCQQSTELTPSPANPTGLVRFAERPNLVSARVLSRFNRALLLLDGLTANFEGGTILQIIGVTFLKA